MHERGHSRSCAGNALPRLVAENAFERFDGARIAIQSWRDLALIEK